MNFRTLTVDNSHQVVIYSVCFAKLPWTCKLLKKLFFLNRFSVHATYRPTIGMWWINSYLINGRSISVYRFRVGHKNLVVRKLPFVKY